MFFRVKRDPEKYVLYCNTEESRNLLEQAKRLRQGDDSDDGSEEYDEIIDDNSDENTSQKNIQEENENGTDY